MKAQTKALVASLIIVALSLSAVSGVTYSWWSDSDNADITVTTGILDVKTKVTSINGEDKEGQRVYGIQIGKPINAIQIVNYFPSGIDNDITINYLVSFYNTIDAKIFVGYESEYSNIQMNVDSETVIQNKFVSVDASADGNTPSAEAEVTLTLSGLQQGMNYNVKVRNEIYQSADPVWDGTYPTNSLVSSGNVYTINSAEDLASFAKMVNDGERFTGKVVNLETDVNLNNHEWKPIGMAVAQDNLNSLIYPAYTFAGTFNGNGHTISNMKISPNGSNAQVAGFFGAISGDAVIDGLTIKDSSISGSHWTGAICGYTYDDVVKKITNCSVINTNVSGISHPDAENPAKNNDGDKVGGIAGSIGGTEITGCVVKDVKISGYRDIGGIVGCVYEISGSSVTGCKIEGTTEITIVDDPDNVEDITTKSGRNAGYYVGRNIALVDLSSNTGMPNMNYPPGLS